MGDYGGNREDIDLDAYPTAKELVGKCIDFFDEVQNLRVVCPKCATLEARLNTGYGPSSIIHKSLTSLVRRGLTNEEGWCATIPIDGPKYRRSKVALPSALTRHFSITTVYMDSEEPYRGQYHQHPYGEINCVITLDDESKAELKGMNGWQGPGWTSPGAGTHHYLEVKGGALVALFFLPARRISYQARPEMPQPATL